MTDQPVPAAEREHKRRSPCCEDEARRFLAAIASPSEEPGLDAAWAEAEAAQEYGRVRSLVEYKDGWEAVWTDGHRVVGDFGHTPAAALHALAARLAKEPGS